MTEAAINVRPELLTEERPLWCRQPGLAHAAETSDLGTSGHTMVVADIVRLVGEYEIVGYLDDHHRERHGGQFLGAPVLGGEEQLPALQAQGVRHLIFGFASSPARRRRHAAASELGFELATAIHPQAIVSAGASIGAGAIVKAGAIVEPGAVIGSNAVVGSAVLVAHEAVVGAAARVCAGTIVGGRTTVGEGTWLGIGVSLKDRVRVGAWSLIGVGAVVVEDIPDGVVAFGVPARIVRRVAAGDL